MGIKKIINKLTKEKEVVKGDASKDKTYSSQKEFSTEAEAAQAFQKSIKKLMDVDSWSKLPGISSGFKLYDRLGNEKKANRPQVKDYIKIDLPGPVPENWVVVTDIKEEENLAEFTVSPSGNPTDIKEDKEKTSHFFVEEASSTFRVEQKSNVLYAFEIGKNEEINNDGEEAGRRKLINTLISEGGWAGFQELQWKKLTDYLVHEINLEE